jgi:hypothetical protein
MARSYKSADARTPEKPPKKAAAASVIKEEVVAVAQSALDHSFHPGDIVSFRSNSRGTVLEVTGNGVRVDFGLGSSWFVKDVLTLIKAASIPEA